MDDQLKVPTETMIMMATNAAIGICLTQSPRKTIISNKNTPAQSVESLPRPPDLTLIMD